MSAQEWVVRTQPKPPVKWRDVEIAAFAEHPSVLDQLDPARAFRGTKRGWELVWGVPAAILVAVVFAAPIWGLTTLVGDRFGRSTLETSGTIPAAGIIFGIGSILLVVNFVRWLRAGKPKEGMRDAQAGMAFVLGAPSIAIVAVQGPRDVVPFWELWVLPIVFTTVVGGVFLVMLRAERGKTRSVPKSLPETVEKQKSSPLARVTDEVALLNPEARDAVSRDLDDAIAYLEARKLITVADAEVARQAELGLLKLRMYQQSRATRAGR